MIAAIFTALFAISFGWNLIAGTGQTPQEFADEHPECSAIAMYGYQNGQWTHWFTGVPDYVNEFHGIDALDPSRGYWVYCAE